MTKKEFLRQLNIKLNGLPTDTINSALDYYSEIIEDSLEDGKSEEEAVEALGDVEAIANKIISETPLKKIIKDKKEKSKGLPTWAIILLIISSPIWVPLVTILGVVSLCITLFILAILIFIVLIIVGIIILGVVLIVYSCWCFIKVSIVNGLFFIGVALMCIGAGILTYGLIKLIFKLIKYLFNKLKELIKKGLMGSGDKNEID